MSSQTNLRSKQVNYDVILTPSEEEETFSLLKSSQNLQALPWYHALNWYAGEERNVILSHSHFALIELIFNMLLKR